jgi:hypothetical protein
MGPFHVFHVPYLQLRVSIVKRILEKFVATHGHQDEEEHYFSSIGQQTNKGSKKYNASIDSRILQQLVSLCPAYLP